MHNGTFWDCTYISYILYRKYFNNESFLCFTKFKCWKHTFVLSQTPSWQSVLLLCMFVNNNKYALIFIGHRRELMTFSLQNVIYMLPKTLSCAPDIPLHAQKWNTFNSITFQLSLVWQITGQEDQTQQKCETVCILIPHTYSSTAEKNRHVLWYIDFSFFTCDCIFVLSLFIPLQTKNTAAYHDNNTFYDTHVDMLIMHYKLYI